MLVLSLSSPAARAGALPAFFERAYGPQQRACRAGFTREYVKAGAFTLMTYQRLAPSCETIRMYIEGDGRAWETRRRLSDDPTPSEPVALELAAVDPADAVVYIARPGQFPAPDAPECDPKYWSSHRFAPEVVEAYDKAIDILKAKAGARRVELVGYSGGGAIAVLVAARRSDIAGLRTVAGNLAPKTVSSYHGVSQLDGSMDPLDAARAVAAIPQRHFISTRDSVVPVSVAESFAGRIGDQSFKSITMVEGTTHTAGWQKAWPALISVSLFERDRSGQ